MTHKGRPGAKPSGLWDELPAFPVPFITCANNNLAIVGFPHSLLLGLELLYECGEMRGGGGREGVVLVLKAFPNC